jgi:hypothetical protein
VNIPIPDSDTTNTTDTSDTSNTTGILQIENTKRVGTLDFVYDQANKRLKVQHDNIIKKLQLISVTGEIVASGHPGQEKVDWYLSGISTGVYVIQMHDSQNNVYIGKLIYN